MPSVRQLDLADMTPIQECTVHAFSSKAALATAGWVVVTIAFITLGSPPGRDAFHTHLVLLKKSTRAWQPCDIRINRPGCESLNVVRTPSAGSAVSLRAGARA